MKLGFKKCHSESSIHSDVPMVVDDSVFVMLPNAHNKGAYCHSGSDSSGQHCEGCNNYSNITCSLKISQCALKCK